MSYYKHHVFFCLNQRKQGEACCADHDAQAAFDHCKTSVKTAGLAGPGGVRINKAGCLGVCEHGPAAVIYPKGSWHTIASVEEAELVIQNHLCPSSDL